MKVTIIGYYDANPASYGTDVPAEMAAIDLEAITPNEDGNVVLDANELLACCDEIGTVTIEPVCEACNGYETVADHEGSALDCPRCTP